ncbi:MAG: gluconate 2-dehydrogenase subunit 3 family protein [Acidobacteriaceae bacterium]|nr:gluconate 2-dehydrogenase subunit 3 family protein [Acidobacteriaceae bacterium]
MPWEPGTAQPPKRIEDALWLFFSDEEACLVEAIVDRLIPSDDLGPGGKDAGCAVFIDRQLAGPYGRGAGNYVSGPFSPGTITQGYQEAASPAERYRAGLREVDRYVKAMFGGRGFPELAPNEQDHVLSNLESGIAHPLTGVCAKEFFKLILKNTMEGFFADPVYGGNRNMIGWKLVGFPGARYDYRDWVERHNEPYPFPPVGIMGSPEWKG